MFPSYISKLTVTATTPILINELRKGKISFSNALCFFANAISQFSQFIYNSGNNVRNKNPISVIQNENPYKQYKNNALDNVLAFGLSDGVKQEALDIPPISWNRNFSKNFNKNFRVKMNVRKYSKRYKKDLSELCVIIICEERRSGGFCKCRRVF